MRSIIGLDGSYNFFKQIKYGFGLNKYNFFVPTIVNNFKRLLKNTQLNDDFNIPIYDK